MNVVIARDAATVKNTYKDSMSGKHNTYIVVAPDKPLMLSGIQPFYTKQECVEANVDVVTVEHSYGSIIIFPGDFSVSFTSIKPNNFGKDAIYAIKTMLKDMNIDVQIEGNDLMVEGYKMGSWVARRHLNCTVTGVQCSINTDAELIKQLCKKPMCKYPGALRDYGINANMVLSYLKQTGIISASFPKGEEIWQT